MHMFKVSFIDDYWTMFDPIKLIPHCGSSISILVLGSFGVSFYISLISSEFSSLLTKLECSVFSMHPLGKKVLNAVSDKILLKS